MEGAGPYCFKSWGSRTPINVFEGNETLVQLLYVWFLQFSGTWGI